MIAEYLKRINYKDSIRLDSRTLIALHKAHVTAIPFENIGVMSGEKIDLSPDFLFKKIILNKRGGICYELNYLFYVLLKRFGFKVSLVSAITKYGNAYGSEYDHMALIVEVDAKVMLVDVGLREALWYPIDISKHAWSRQGKRSYSVFSDILGNFHFLKETDGRVFEEYKFALNAREPHEFAGMFVFHESNPMSPINRYLMCCLDTKQGRIVVKGENIIIEDNDGQSSEFNLVNDKNSFLSLKNYCAIFGFDHSIYEKIFNILTTRRTIAA